MSQSTAAKTAAPQVDDNDDVLDDKPKRWYVDVTDSAAETHRAMLVQWIFVFVMLVGSTYWHLGDEMIRMLPDLV
ncbi:uncharacterized protein PG998_012759 [Apiospora kogelbergensis]|uniref:Uncharacterized protein n=1 Tax=Apiospora kogelbergensis TaxID=1337665 RepID=A0AAW0QDQ5_9PEZI